ncbi:MAG: dTDP-4-dehydrorhamnose reductase [Rhizobiaceae bacterium]
MTGRSRKRALVTGKAGQVVNAINVALAGSQDFELVLLGRPEVDFAHADGIAAKVAALKPDYVVNAAAYTAVDKAEDEPDLAMQVNAMAAGAVAQGAAIAGAPVIQISTDYVFDGTKDAPYNEGDAVGPIGSYGRSKLAGEQAVAHANSDHVIMRTSWVYSSFGANFVKTMLRYGAERDVMKVVSDQHGNPTAAHDIAHGILAMIHQLESGNRSSLGHVFHFAGKGDTTWFGFAEGIFEESASLGGPHVRVEAIATSEFPTKAKRPANSRLDCRKFEAQFGYKIADWRTSLRHVLGQLIEKS